jgi:DNA-binding transcriptional ArsR family regulator
LWPWYAQGHPPDRQQPERPRDHPHRLLIALTVSGNLPFVATYRMPALEALADPRRRSIFELLGDGPLSVVDITRNVPISRPAVSQHLKALRDAGLVTVRSAGTRRIYGLDPTGVAAARDYFDQFWTTALAAYAQVASTTEEEQ